MLLYNLSEYSRNYFMASGSLWNYYRDEINYVANEAANTNRINNNKRKTSKDFEYKIKLLGNTPNNNKILGAEVSVPLKCLSNFWISVDLSLINCEIELDLSCSKYCVISEVSRTFRAVGNPAVQQVATQTTGGTFQINNAKLYVSVVTLSISDNIKFLENIKQGFKRTISWNKFRSEITAQPRNNYLDYLIHATFTSINRLFVLLFRNGDEDPARNSFERLYMPLVEIKDFNVLIDNKPFFDQPVKSKRKAYEKLIEMSINDDYTTENLLDFLYHEKNSLSLV